MQIDLWKRFIVQYCLLASLLRYFVTVHDELQLRKAYMPIIILTKLNILINNHVSHFNFIAFGHLLWLWKDRIRNVLLWYSWSEKRPVYMDHESKIHNGVYSLFTRFMVKSTACILKKSRLWLRSFIWTSRKTKQISRSDRSCYSASKWRERYASD